MIHYAVHDVIAVTYLIRPVTENWTFERIRRRRMDEIFIGFKSTELPSLPSSMRKKKIKKNINLHNLFNSTEDDLEQISDDEIQLNRLIEPNDRKNGQDDIMNDEEPVEQTQQQQVPEHEDNELEQISDGEIIMDPASVNNHRVVVDAQNYQDDNAKLRKQRSIESKKRRNKKSTERRRKHSYHHTVIRRIYSNFPMHLVKKILRFYQIDITHVRLGDEEKEELIIGLKNRTVKQEAERILPSNIFSKNSYFYYKKKFR
jgi:hypothetical protein